MYELLFRSRWYALAWAVFMAISAVVFTTTGAVSASQGKNHSAQASSEPHDSQFTAWSQDDSERAGDEPVDDAVNADHRPMRTAQGDAAENGEAEGPQGQ